MQRLIHISFAAIILLLSISCTTSRWVVKDREAVDNSDYEVLNEQTFLHMSDSLSPENPVLELEVLSNTTFEYTEKILVERTIQEYRLRPGFVILGLAGGAAAFYAGNSSHFGGNRMQSITLNTIGAILSVSGFFNLKPDGDPRPVGEERYLNDTGTLIETDTVHVDKDVASPASISVTYNNRTVFEEELTQINGGQISIPLANRFEDLNLTDPQPGQFEVKIEFQDSTYHYINPVSSILEPYAQVNSEFTELRREPMINPENVLAQLAEGSQVYVEGIHNNDWYKVRYGIFESYIRRDDAGIQWRTANFSEDTEIVTIPTVPFGNIDVESNIPKLRDEVQNAQALIVTNESYVESLPQRRYSHRDGQLIEAYLKEALGYKSEHIHFLKDVNEPQQVFDVIEKIDSSADENTELFVYIAGYGDVKADQEGSELFLKNIEEETNVAVDLPLKALLTRVGNIPAQQKWVLADIDFSRNVPDTLSNYQAEQFMASHASSFTEDPNTALLLGSEPGRPSRLYRSSTENKNHHIFPYLFARALQQHRTDIIQIYSLLNQNISYTSRRLHDRSQSPMLYGDRTLSFFIPER